MSVFTDAIPGGILREIEKRRALKPKVGGRKTLGDYLSNDDVRIRAYGGLSAGDVRQLYAVLAAIGKAKKSIFYVEVESIDAALGLETESTTNEEAHGLFALFATDVDYNAVTLQGEKRRIGAAHQDVVQSREPITVSITTYDEPRGGLKRWFDRRAALVSPGDGTVGLPAEYGLQLTIVHDSLEPDRMPAKSAPADLGLIGRLPPVGIDLSGRMEKPYATRLYVRPESIAINLTRATHEVQQLQMVFTELDTFMLPTPIR